jgi:hypothetical protein
MPKRLAEWDQVTLYEVVKIESKDLRDRPQKSVFLAIFSGIAKPKSPPSLDKYTTTINCDLL